MAVDTGQQGWSQLGENLKNSVSRTRSFLLILSTISAYVIKVFDKKPLSLQWVEENFKDYWARYISPESVSDSFEFFISVMFLWISAIIFHNMCLKWILTYKGWMFESRGNVSLITRVWAAVLRILSAGSEGFYSFYNFCPSLPVPQLEDTVERYLTSMTALLNEKEFNELKKHAADFLASVGPAIQSALIKKSWLSANYVSDWWEEFVYLRSRDSLMINSNYFGLGYYQIPTESQTSRAAGILWAILKWRKDLIENKVGAMKLQKLVPLCPAQYKRLFGTSRVPKENKDEIVTAEASNHVIVFCHGKAFAVEVLNEKNGSVYSLKYFESCMEKIKEDTSGNEAGKICQLAAGTAMKRNQWASVRETIIKNSAENAESIEIIESALFHIWLDPECISLEKKNLGMQQLSRRSLHGNGENLWFDKSFTVTVSANGHHAFNAEHTWADGAVMMHLAEEISVLEHLLIEYCPKTGRILGDKETKIPIFRALTFTNLPKLLGPIQNALPEIRQSIENLSMAQLCFEKFGKGEMKKWRLSPDAICQLAMQMSNFRVRGKLSMTYEPALARIFKDGRTETIRSCTPAAAAFIHEMSSENVDKEKRRQLLSTAVRAHGELTKQAMIGQGVDRHLFALCVAAGGLGYESEFLNKYKDAKWQNVNGWELSTSGAPIGLGDLFNPQKYRHLQPMGAGFGWTNGFGIGYMIYEDSLNFSISCSKSQNLDSQKFKDTLSECLHEIKALFD